MELEFEAHVVMRLDHKEGARPRVIATDLHLGMNDILDRSMYMNEDGVPNEDGVKVFTNILVQGLVGNIHYAHQNGYIDSAKHLRYVIEQLERGFMQVVNIEKGVV